MRCLVVAKPDDSQEWLDELPVIDTYLTKNTKRAPLVPETDPFLKELDDIKGLSGLSSNRKRSITTMQKRYEGTGGAGSKQIEDPVSVTGYNAFEVIQPPYNLDYLSKIYEVSSPHYSAVNAKVANIVGLGYKFVESNKTKHKFEDMEGNEDALKKLRRKLSRATESFEELLDSLNQEDTFTETLIKVWRDYEATGNGYIEIGRKSNGQIGYIGHIHASTIRVRRARDGFVQIIADKAVFFRNYGQSDKNPVGDDANPNEIIHIKKASPSNAYYGVPDIISASNALAGNEYADRFNLDYFENKAVPRHLITLKGGQLGANLSAKLLEFFETIKGQNHRSLFIPLPAGSKERPVELNIHPIETNIQDSSFENYRKANLNAILMAHRVPLSKVGLAEGVNLAVARDADKNFKEQVCQPEQRMLEKKLNKIVAEFTDLFVLKLNEMTLSDEDQQSIIDERDIKNGIKTRNEVRAARGLSGIEGGDELVRMEANAQARAEANTTRQRDSRRSAARSDSVGEGRQTKGDGRASD